GDFSSLIVRILGSHSKNIAISSPHQFQLNSAIPLNSGTEWNGRRVSVIPGRGEFGIGTSMGILNCCANRLKFLAGTSIFTTAGPQPRRCPTWAANCAQYSAVHC